MSTTDLYFTEVLDNQQGQFQRTPPGAGISPLENTSFSKPQDLSYPEQVDWNSQFQECLRLTWDVEQSSEIGLERSIKLRQLCSRFAETASSVAQKIIEELSLPFNQRTIQPCSDAGGIAGGEKYFHSGIFLKLSRDWKSLYGGDSNSIKAAEHELKGGMAYLDCRISQLSLPLMALIRYRGHCLLAESIVPIDKSTLVYGSNNGGKTVLPGTNTIAERMKIAARQINIKAHKVYSHTTSKFITLHGPIDLECHIGKDGLFYVLDTARVFPPAAPVAGSKKSTYLYKLLRPEFVRLNPVPLSSDGFSKFGRDDELEHNEEILDATIRLESHIIPEFAQYLSNRYAFSNLTMDARTQASPHTSAIDYEDESPVSVLRKYPHKQLEELNHLVAEMHLRGINVRYAFAIANLTNSGLIRTLLYTEVVARVIKLILEQEWRALDSSDNLAYHTLTAHFLSFVFSTTEESLKFWYSSIVNELTSRFPMTVRLNKTKSDPRTFSQLVSSNPTDSLPQVSLFSTKSNYSTSSQPNNSLSDSEDEDNKDSYSGSSGSLSGSLGYRDPVKFYSTLLANSKQDSTPSVINEDNVTNNATTLMIGKNIRRTVDMALLFMRVTQLCGIDINFSALVNSDSFAKYRYTVSPISLAHFLPLESSSQQSELTTSSASWITPSISSTSSMSILDHEDDIFEAKWEIISHYVGMPPFNPFKFSLPKTSDIRSFNTNTESLTDTLSSMNPRVLPNLTFRAVILHPECIAKIKPRTKYFNRISYEEGTALTRLALTKSPNEAFQLFSQANRKFSECLAIKPDDARGLFNWAFSLTKQAECICSTNPLLANQLWREAYSKYERALVLKPNDWRAHANWGTALSCQASRASLTKESISAYYSAVEQFDKSINIMRIMPLSSSAQPISELSSMKSVDGLPTSFELKPVLISHQSRSEDESLKLRSYLQVDFNTLYNSANARLRLARLLLDDLKSQKQPNSETCVRTYEECRELLNTAIVQFEYAAQIEPTIVNATQNLAVALATKARVAAALSTISIIQSNTIANTSNDQFPSLQKVYHKERDQLFALAYLTYQKALHLLPWSVEICLGYGNALFRHAMFLKEQAEPDLDRSFTLLCESAQRYEPALMFSESFPRELFFNFGSTLYLICKQNKRSENLPTEIIRCVSVYLRILPNIELSDSEKSQTASILKTFTKNKELNLHPQISRQVYEILNKDLVSSDSTKASQDNQQTSKPQNQCSSPNPNLIVRDGIKIKRKSQRAKGSEDVSKPKKVKSTPLSNVGAVDDHLQSVDSSVHVRVLSTPNNIHAPLIQVPAIETHISKVPPENQLDDNLPSPSEKRTKKSNLSVSGSKLKSRLGSLFGIKRSSTDSVPSLSTSSSTTSKSLTNSSSITDTTSLPKRLSRSGSMILLSTKNKPSRSMSLVEPTLVPTLSKGEIVVSPDIYPIKKSEVPTLNANTGTPKLLKKASSREEITGRSRSRSDVMSRKASPPDTKNKLASSSTVPTNSEIEAKPQVTKPKSPHTVPNTTSTTNSTSSSTISSPTTNTMSENGLAESESLSGITLPQVVTPTPKKSSNNNSPDPTIDRKRKSDKSKSKSKSSGNNSTQSSPSSSSSINSTQSSPSSQNKKESKSSSSPSSSTKERKKKTSSSSTSPNTTSSPSSATKKTKVKSLTPSNSSLPIVTRVHKSLTSMASLPKSIDWTKPVVYSRWEEKSISESDFVFKGILGNTRSGLVFAATRDNEEYAIKVRMLNDDSSSNISFKKSLLVPFFDHPFISRLDYFLITDTKCIMAYKMIHGPHLFDYISIQAANLPPDIPLLDHIVFITVAAQLVSAWSYMVDELKIPFRDFKSSNVLINDSGNIILTTQMEEDNSNFHFSRADITYLSPEIIRKLRERRSLSPVVRSTIPDDATNRLEDRRASWWSLGIFLYVIATGKIPFRPKDWSLAGSSSNTSQSSSTPTSILSSARNFPIFSSDDPEIIRIEENILKYRITIPTRFGKLSSLLQGLLNKDITDRLCTSEAVKAHPFFQKIDWTSLTQLKTHPPFLPNIVPSQPLTTAPVLSKSMSLNSSSVDTSMDLSSTTAHQIALMNTIVAPDQGLQLEGNSIFIQNTTHLSNKGELGGSSDSEVSDSEIIGSY